LRKWIRNCTAVRPGSYRCGAWRRALQKKIRAGFSRRPPLSQCPQDLPGMIGLHMFFGRAQYGLCEGPLDQLSIYLITYLSKLAWKPSSQASTKTRDSNIGSKSTAKSVMGRSAALARKVCMVALTVYRDAPSWTAYCITTPRSTLRARATASRRSSRLGCWDAPLFSSRLPVVSGQESS
jgi:hypothetical protein